MNITELKELLDTLKVQADIVDLPVKPDDQPSYRKSVSEMSAFIERKLEDNTPFTERDLSELFDKFADVRKNMAEYTANNQEGMFLSASNTLERIENIAAGLDVRRNISLTQAIENQGYNSIKLNRRPDSMGAASSQRQMVTMTFKDNSKTQGFFTQDSKLFALDKNDRVKNMLIKARDDKKNKNNELLKSVCDSILKSDYGPSGLLLCMNTNYTKKNRNLGQCYDIKGLMAYKPLGCSIEEAAMNKELSDLLLDVRSLFTENDVKNFHRISGQYGKRGVDAGLKSSLASRNIAMSNVATILGVPNIVAKSSFATAQWEGEHVKGVFTEKVEGSIPPAQGEYDGTDFAKFKDDTAMDGECLKSMADLQILDYICGNVDRHQSNISYIIGDDGKLKGVQGFDNDWSFGKKVLADNTAMCNGVPFDDITVISESMAKRILDMDAATLKGALLETGVDEDEITTAIGRFNHIKRRVEEGNAGPIEIRKIKVIKDDEWKNMKLDDLAKAVDPLSVRKDAKGSTRIRKNIFGQARVIRLKGVGAKEKVHKEPQYLDENELFGDAPVQKAPRKKGFANGSRVEEITTESFKEKVELLKAYSEKLAKAKKAFSGKSTEYEALEKAVKEATMYKTDSFPDENTRNSFIADMEKVQKAAEAYIAYKVPKNDTGDVGTKRLRLARELSAFTTKELPVFKEASLELTEKALEQHANEVKMERKILTTLAKQTIKAHNGEGELEATMRLISSSAEFGKLMNSDYSDIVKYADMAEKKPGEFYDAFSKKVFEKNAADKKSLEAEVPKQENPSLGARKL